MEEQNPIKILGESELFERHHIVCTKGTNPLRIDKYLAGKIAHVSRNRIQQAIVASWVQVNGLSVKSNYKVQPYDDIICYTTDLPDYETIVPQQMDLSIVYEDETIMIVNKPPYVVVHPGLGNPDQTLLNGIAFRLTSQMGEDQASQLGRYGLVHRIDKETSGLLAVAKTSSASSALSKQFFDHSIERTYVGLVWGDMKDNTGTIEGNIGRHEYHRKKFDVYPDIEKGKHAITHYKVLERFGYTTLVSFQLETGRTHQIRVHMQWKGHPIFMDKLYGGDTIYKGTIFSKYKQFVENTFALCPRHVLHALSLGFQHPATKKQIYFEAPLPDDIQSVIDKWRVYSR